MQLFTNSTKEVRDEIKDMIKKTERIPSNSNPEIMRGYFEKYLDQISLKNGVPMVNDAELRELAVAKFGANHDDFLRFAKNRLIEKQAEFRDKLDGYAELAKGGVNEKLSYSPKNEMWDNQMASFFNKYDDYVFKTSAKGAYGRIDDAGLVEKLYSSVNPFSKDSVQSESWNKLASRTTPEGLFVRMSGVAGGFENLANKTVEQRNIALSNLPSGSLIGIDSSANVSDYGKAYGIDRVALLEKTKDKSYIIESRPGDGVVRTELDKWLDIHKDSKLYGVDRSKIETAIARGAKVSDLADVEALKREMSAINARVMPASNFNERKLFLEVMSDYRSDSTKSPKDAFVERYIDAQKGVQGSERNAINAYDRLSYEFLSSTAKNIGEFEESKSHSLFEKLVQDSFSGRENIGAVAKAAAGNDVLSEHAISEDLKNSKDADLKLAEKLIAMPGTWKPEDPTQIDGLGRKFLISENGALKYTGINVNLDTGRVIAGNPEKNIEEFISDYKDKAAVKETLAEKKAKENNEAPIRYYSREELGEMYLTGSTEKSQPNSNLSDEYGNKDILDQLKKLGDEVYRDRAGINKDISNSFSASLNGQPINLLQDPINALNNNMYVDRNEGKTAGSYIASVKAARDIGIDIDPRTEENIRQIGKRFEELRDVLARHGVNPDGVNDLLGKHSDELQKELIARGTYIPLAELSTLNSPTNEEAWKNDKFYALAKEGKDVTLVMTNEGLDKEALLLAKKLSDDAHRNDYEANQKPQSNSIDL